MTIMYLLWTIHTQKDTKRHRDTGNAFTLDYSVFTHKKTQKNRERERETAIETEEMY